MIHRISNVIGQLIAFLSALVGYLRSASTFLYAASSKPLISVSPTLVITASVDPAGSVVDVNDKPALVRKSLALSHSENFDHGPTKMWKLQSFAATVIGFAFANDSSAGLT